METQQSLRSLQKKRTTNFREDETKLLIQLWGSPQIQNKLYLTHRKEPVMRLLAHNMQQRGFYRTPDEIKTRIRNLKCLYHRIKRSVQSGAGIGTVDPDWPHYKAMDQILAKQGQKKDIYKDNVFEGPRCEDIKQEIDDIDINDDMESYTTNSLGGSEYEEDQMQMPPLTPAPTAADKKKDDKTPIATTKYPTILPNITIPTVNHPTATGAANVRSGSIPSLPFPLLILNGVQPHAAPVADKKELASTPKISAAPMKGVDEAHLLREILDVQKENLNIEKQRLAIDKQRLEFERFVWTHLLALAPAFGGMLQKSPFDPGQDSGGGSEGGKKGGRKRRCEFDMFKDSSNKLLRNLLGEKMKKIIQDDEEEESENEDSGVHNDDDISNSSK